MKLFLLMGVSAAALVALGPGVSKRAEAACSGLPGTAGPDTIVCDGNAPDPTAFFNTGAGADSVTITGGTITVDAGDIDGQPGIGAVSVRQEDGADRFEISGGTVQGAVIQGADIDTFVMSGGQIAALNQGSGLDVAQISGGRIVGLFFAGDDVTMTGGQIGTVDLEQANNILRLSGGTIDTDVLAQQGADTLIMSGGSIGGTVNFRNGNNIFLVTGGSIGGDVQSGTGTDSFTWDGGGTIGGSVTLGDNDDMGVLRNLTDAMIGATVVDGQTGIDTLTFEATTATWTAARFLNWENVNLNDGTALTATGVITLGDAGTGTGTLQIDSSSTLFAANASFSALNPATPAMLINAGAIDLTNGAGATDTFTVNGQYTGNGGRVVLDTVLGSDGSASDRLILATLPATGTTGLEIRNLGGPGALTTADGILVVEEQGGASAGAAFYLASPAAAGAFDYLLYQGNLAGDEPNNWYLRSQLIDTGPNAEPPIPLFRPEVAVHSAVPPLVRELTTTILGTFHERRGEQALFADGKDNRFWMRGFAQYLDMSWSGTVDPSFEGSVFGFQAGADLYRKKTESGHVTAFGLFIGYGRLNGDVEGFAQAIENFDAGRAPVDGYSIGANVVHIGPSGWYLDGVLMGTLLDGKPHSDRGVSSDLDGDVVTASLEGGFPIPLGEGFALEPQAQVIWQHVDIDDGEDDFAEIRYDTPDTFSGRIGARLTGTFGADGGASWQPYLKANLWYSPSETDKISFDADDVETEIGTTAVEVGGGVVAALTEDVRFFATGDYLFDVGGEKKEAVEGNLGLQLMW
ncbi:autotransporter family protein [Taklimakanibacter lacteus]|uniref:autotransporter family protein n=1 Tax=Taklimakanibacter lacteus TaxID=2268456 RepID=UPI000E66B98B